MEKEICEKYLAFVSIRKIAREYHLGDQKIKDILTKNGIEIRDAHSIRMAHNYVITDYKHEKYPNEDGYQYAAVAKDGSVCFYDHNNKGGHLTTYIEEKYGVKTPTLYDRRKYYMETGNYWWEQWFDIIKEKCSITKKCPYCEWETNDLENKSGAFSVHLERKHGMTVEDYLNEHPEDKDYFKKQVRLINKKESFKDAKNYVLCPICNEKFEKITRTHIEKVHNMTYEEFKERYPNIKVLSDQMLEQTRNVQHMANLVVSKKHFISSYEREIGKILKENGLSIETNRQILIGKEIDILCPEKKIGLEFDGLKFHTEWFGRKSHTYHLDKTKKCNEKGYGLIHVFEDEYVNNKELVINKILHIFGVQKDKCKIMARKCLIKKILKNDAESFLNKYHIQGYVKSSVYYGAFYEDELVAVMTFKNGNIKNPNWELTRYATNYNYICQGLGSRMFYHFVRENRPEEVISFADRRWTVDINNNLYTKMGFTIMSINPPDYKYYNDRVEKYKRYHKLYFNKKKLNKKYGFPLTMTETEMTRELGFDRIWDCGLVKYVWNRDDNKPF